MPGRRPAGSCFLIFFCCPNIGQFCMPLVCSCFQCVSLGTLYLCPCPYSHGSARPAAFSVRLPLPPRFMYPLRTVLPMPALDTELPLDRYPWPYPHPRPYPEDPALVPILEQCFRWCGVRLQATWVQEWFLAPEVHRSPCASSSLYLRADTCSHPSPFSPSTFLIPCPQPHRHSLGRHFASLAQWLVLVARGLKCTTLRTWAPFVTVLQGMMRGTASRSPRVPRPLACHFDENIASTFGNLNFLAWPLSSAVNTTHTIQVVARSSGCEG